MHSDEKSQLNFVELARDLTHRGCAVLPLIDRTRQENVRDIMLKCGFSIKSYNRTKHDVYIKRPVCNFQMHVSLFEEDSKSVLYNYFKDIDKRLLKDSDSGLGRHFTDEDFYLYIKAHEYNHFSKSGTGLRNIVDTYIIQATPTADAASSRPLRSRTPPAPSSRRTLIIR